MNQSPAPSMANQGNTLQLADVVRVLKKYGVYVVGLALLGGVIATIWGKLQPNLYDASAMVHLSQHGTISLSSIAAASDDYQLRTQTEIVGMQSPVVAEETMRRLHLAENPVFNPNRQSHSLDNPVERDRLVKMFQGALSVSSLPKTELISIRFRSQSPVMSALVVNTLVDVFFEQSFQQRYKSTQEISGYLTTEMDQLRSKIQAEQNDLLNLETELGLLQSGSDKGQSSLLESQVEGTLAEETHAQTNVYQSEAEYDNLVEHPNTALPAQMPGAEALNSLQSMLTQSQSQLAAAESRYGPNHPLVQQQKAQVDLLQKSYEDARQQAIKATGDQVNTARQELAKIDNRLQTLKEQSKSQTPKTVRFAILKAQYESDQTLYNVLLAALGTGAIQAGLQGQDLNRFTAAEVPGIRSYPVISTIALGGAGIGLVLGLVLVAVILVRSDTVETVEQVEQILPVPVLAAVPEYKDDIAAARMAEGAVPLVTLLAPRSAGTEAYRLLRTAISLMPVSSKHRVIALTSGGPGEGKSTTTMNLAVVLATQSKRVLLIDADLRKPTMAQRLKLPASDQPGLSRFLSDREILPEACIQHVAEVPGLDIVPVQEVPPFPSELLAQGRLGELLAWARDHYDYVLIDTPPVLLVADALIVTAHCDTLLVVVRVGVAQKRGLMRIRQDLAKYPDKQTGLVVNALPISDTYYGGYGNYRKYYGGKGYGSYGKGTYSEDN